MATIAYTVLESARYGSSGWTVYKWANMGDDDVGEPAKITEPGVVTLAVQGEQESGNWGAAALTFEGSLDDVHYDMHLDDPDGAAISFSADAGEYVREGPVPVYVRPQTAGGTGTDITALLMVRYRA